MKPITQQAIGKKADQAADKSQRNIDAMHDVDNLRREVERLKAEQIETRYVGPRMYKREVYGK